MSAAGLEADLEYRVGKLRVAPDDVLIIKFARTPSMEEVRRMKGAVRHYIPKVKVLFIDHETDLAVLTAEEIARRSA